MSRLVDLSPAVPEGFRGPPSTDVGVRCTFFAPFYKFAGIDSARAFAQLPDGATP